MRIGSVEIVIGVVAATAFFGHWALEIQSERQRTRALLADSREYLEKSRGTEEGTWKAAKDAIELQLKCPSTVVYGTPRLERVNDISSKNISEWHEWKVTGYLDAQNSYGAMIRSNFEVGINCDNGVYTTAFVRLIDR